VERLVAEAQHLGLTVALWALERVSDRLSEVTIGSGPGPRLLLLNRLYEAVAPALRGLLVLSDDDVTFVRGGLGPLLWATKRCGFAIAQPGHAPRSHAAYEFTRSQPLTVARQTTFVEIGPIVVVSAPVRSRIMPLPEDFGMGWGVDLLWHDLVREHWRLGIVDAVSIRHLALSGVLYDTDPEQERLDALLRARRLSSVEEIQRCLGTWRAWQWRPPWESMVAPSTT
jgi:hypothetical protein